MHITRPLEQYRQEFKDKFKEVAENTFDGLARKSNVDIEANRVLCSEIYSLQNDASDVRKKLNRNRWLCALLWCIVAGVIIYALAVMPDGAVISLLAIVAIICLFLLFSNVHPTIKRLKEERDELEDLIKQKTNVAWGQMEALNNLYDWNIFYRMFSEVIPAIAFDDYVPAHRLLQLRAHGLQTYRGDDSSILYAHSGTINGNPFVLFREREFQWGTKTYTGTKTIHWTTRERGADGKYETRYHSEILTATIVKPFPEFPECTRLVYGHSAAPSLAFHRQKNSFNYKAGGLLYSLKKKRLERKSRKLSSDYAMDSNDEFEVLFTATDRTDNQQFFLLFTPLAQQSIIELLQDTADAYGDDFTFEKEGELNQIVADHLQSMALELNPSLFRNFNFDEARQRFVSLNCDFFRAVYFTLSPLLSIPLYQDAPNGYMTQHSIAQRTESSEWEIESLANFWGETEFNHPKCETASILKTRIKEYVDGSKIVGVTAHGYGSTQRVTYVRKFGGDGRWHNVPVFWDEYYPVIGEGTFKMEEIIENEASQMTSEEDNAQHRIIHKFRHSSLIRRRIASALS